jgi:predicted nucleic-acid-binding Zn-ribbon protein
MSSDSPRSAPRDFEEEILFLWIELFRFKVLYRDCCINVDAEICLRDYLDKKFKNRPINFSSENYCKISDDNIFHSASEEQLDEMYELVIDFFFEIQFFLNFDNIGEYPILSDYIDYIFHSISLEGAFHSSARIIHSKTSEFSCEYGCSHCGGTEFYLKKIRNKMIDKDSQMIEIFSREKRKPLYVKFRNTNLGELIYESINSSYNNLDWLHILALS